MSITTAPAAHLCTDDGWNAGEKFISGVISGSPNMLSQNRQELILPLSFKPFAQVDLDDLKRLQINAVPEGLRIDYKRDNYAANDGREFLKDITSFANSHGGYLVIGAEEDNGLIASILGVSSSKIDDEIQRLENWARDGVEPRIVGLQMRRIEVAKDRSVVVIAVPKSLNPPHRVSSQGLNRFFVRNSNGKHEASVEELRQLFGFSSQLSDEIQRFVARRRDRIASGNDFVTDLAQGRLIVHVVNASTFGDRSFIDLKSLYLNPYKFAGPHGGGITRRMTLEGIIVGAEAEGKFFDRTLIFRDGSVETVYSALYHKPQGVTLMPGLALMENLLHAVEKSLKGIIEWGGSGPFVINVAIQTEKGMEIAFYNNTLRGHPKFDRDIVELPPLTLMEYDSGTPVPTTIRPLLDALWNAVGLPECGYFQGDNYQQPR